MKELRQQQIRDIVEHQPVRTQQELVSALRQRGLRATQATVSRDVAELGLLKRTRGGVQAYALPPRVDETEASGEERLAKLVHDLPLDVRQAGLLLVVRAVPGSAHAIAAALDRSRWPEVIGSLAGDDTLFIAFADQRSLQRVQARLLALAERGAAG